MLKELKIKTILVSQPAPAVIEKSPFYDISEKYGAKVDYHPFIKVVGVSLKEFRSQRVEILDHSAIIFTNRIAVDSFFRICEETRITVPESMKYFCNTEAIALYLQKYIVYRKRKIFFADGKFDSFMELILKHKDEKMLLTLTEPHNPDIPDAMKRLKFDFSKAIMAKTISADLSDVDVRKYDLLAFYSPSEIAALVENFGVKSLPMVATFGNGTTSSACAAGITVSAMAPMPEVPSMAKAVDILINKLNRGQSVEPIVVNGNCQSEEFVKAQEAKPSRKTRVRKKTATPASKAAIASKAASASKTPPASKTAAPAAKTAPAKKPQPKA